MKVGRYHFPAFAQATIYQGASLLRAMETGNTHGLACIIPALGVKSDVEIKFDGVSLLKSKSRPHGQHSVQFAGVSRSDAHGHSKDTMISMRGTGSNQTGPGTYRLLMRQLRGAGFIIY